MISRCARHLLLAGLLFVLGSAVTSPCHGQESDLTRDITMPTHAAQRTSTPPVVDGVLDDAAWTEATVIDGFRQVEPNTGQAPTERTELRLLYDDDALYVAFRCFASGGERDVVASIRRRDGSLSPDDHVVFVVDPYFDRRNGFYFEIGAAGARGDGLIEDNDRLRRDWDGIWQGRSTVDDAGWSAEFAIPFKTISFNAATTRWSFNAGRFIRNRNETIRWASPTPDRSIISLSDAGIIENITDIRTGIGLDVKPYGLLGVSRNRDTDDTEIDVDGGADLFYRISTSLTLAVTLNTDFAETEVDARRVNLTRFPLFFPEKRDFFLQDAGIFSFGGINRNPLPFFSRRIGLSNQGQALDIVAGAKVTGRVGNLNLGLLGVQMDDDDQLGDKTYFVGRASVNVLEQSTVGLLLTNGEASNPDDNTLAGFDFNYRQAIFNDERIVDGHAWVQFSDSTGVDGGESAYGFKLGYPNDRVQWEIGYSEIGGNFNAGLGFVPRRSIREYFANWRYRWRPEDDGIRRIDVGGGIFAVTDLEDDIESRSARFDILDLETESGDGLSLSFVRQREVLDTAFTISDGVTIPTGDYRFDRYTIDVDTSRGRPFEFGVRYGGGEFYDGRRDEYAVDLEWRVSPQWSVAGEFELNDVRLSAGDFITRIIRGRCDFFFTPDVSWTNFVQFDNVSRTIGLNSRFRWIIEPGNELFVVLNQTASRNDGHVRVTRTELTTKLGWTFRY